MYIHAGMAPLTKQLEGEDVFTSSTKENGYRLSDIPPCFVVESLPHGFLDVDCLTILPVLFHRSHLPTKHNSILSVKWALYRSIGSGLECFLPVFHDFGSINLINGTSNEQLFGTNT